MLETGSLYGRVRVSILFRIHKIWSFYLRERLGEPIASFHTNNDIARSHVSHLFANES
jgi:hypothetical protein